MSEHCKLRGLLSQIFFRMVNRVKMSRGTYYQIWARGNFSFRTFKIARGTNRGMDSRTNGRQCKMPPHSGRAAYPSPTLYGSNDAICSLLRWTESEIRRTENDAHVLDTNIRDRSCNATVDEHWRLKKHATNTNGRRFVCQRKKPAIICMQARPSPCLGG